jgi:hypothetical protein
VCRRSERRGPAVATVRGRRTAAAAPAVARRPLARRREPAPRLGRLRLLSPSLDPLALHRCHRDRHDPLSQPPVVLLVWERQRRRRRLHRRGTRLCWLAVASALLPPPLLLALPLRHRKLRQGVSAAWSSNRGPRTLCRRQHPCRPVERHVRRCRRARRRSSAATVTRAGTLSAIASVRCSSRCGRCARRSSARTRR